MYCSLISYHLTNARVVYDGNLHFDNVPLTRDLEGMFQTMWPIDSSEPHVHSVDSSLSMDIDEPLPNPSEVLYHTLK